MGLADRIRGGLRTVWSPITVWMADQGSDQLVHAGQPATVKVDVRGEDDGTAERVEITLVLRYAGNTQERVYKLGECVPTIGLHELQVDIPDDLPPSCASYAEYSYGATLHRSRGTGSSAGMVVDVISRPENAYWPDARAGQDGAGDPRIAIALDGDTVAMGHVVTGRVTIFAATGQAARDVDLALDVTRTVPGTVKQGTFKDVTKTVVKDRLASAVTVPAGQSVELPLRVEIPAGVAPTLQVAERHAVTWRVRVTHGDATGWASVAVTDPEGTAGIRNQGSPSLAAFLDDVL